LVSSASPSTAFDGFLRCCRDVVERPDRLGVLVIDHVDGVAVVVIVVVTFVVMIVIVIVTFVVVVVLFFRGRPGGGELAAALHAAAAGVGDGSRGATGTTTGGGILRSLRGQLRRRIARDDHRDVAGALANAGGPAPSTGRKR
jgi:hypothetical protein